MIKNYLQAIGSSVISFRDGSRLGLIRDVVVDPQDGKIVGVLVFSGALGKIKTTAVSALEILEWRKEMVVQDEGSLSEPEENIRLQKILEDKIFIFRAPVYTVSGKYLGKTRDFFFNLDYLVLTKILVVQKKWWFFSKVERIFPVAKIVEIRKDRIIVKEDKATLRKKVQKKRVRSNFRRKVAPVQTLAEKDES